MKKRTAANAACSCYPPTRRAMSLSIWRFDVSQKRWTPHNKHRGGWHIEKNRERKRIKGRTIDRWTQLWLKMAAVHTADCVVRDVIHRKTVLAVYISAQQKQLIHRKAHPNGRYPVFIVLNLWRWRRLRLPLFWSCVVCRFIFCFLYVLTAYMIWF